MASTQRIPHLGPRLDDRQRAQRHVHTAGIETHGTATPSSEITSGPQR